MSLTVGWAEPSDAPALRSFVEVVYGAGSIQAVRGRWDWLGRDHPRGMHVALARDDGRVVGASCHVPVRIAAGTLQIDAAYGLDLIVEASARGRGVAKALVALRLDRFSASLSTGQSPAMAALYAKVGALDLGPVWRALRVRRPSLTAAPRAAARDLVAWALGVVRGGRGGTRRSLSIEDAAALLSSLDPRFAPEEAGPHPDTAAFAWRYGGPIYGDHECWQVASGPSRGLVVTRRDVEGEVVVDVFAKPEELPAILRGVANTSPAHRLVASFHGERLRAAFSAAGWLVRPLDARFVILSRQAALLAELARRPWVLFGGESDLDLLRYPPPTGSEGRNDC